ncbi:hypothetical protein [Streptomyces coffeae]|uniref:Alpha/beta hydrolase n=1 Tax=Streptomyces coffeae TaxID=621382 RepID=A0ABS1NER3_9ACTN|nr:hypothetical protein [Streptomyces coffeae]MBL1098597.1 hypothetical protein [Streptomyces coffeae]
MWKGIRINSDHVAMVGHSAGGFSTVPAMAADARVRAGVNLDGNFRYPNDTPLDRPFLIAGNPGRVPGGADPTWDDTCGELTGWRRWLTVDDTEHLPFTDLAPPAKRLGVRYPEVRFRQR